MSKDLYGGDNLFSYFEGSFFTPENEVTPDVDNIKLSSFTPKINKTQKNEITIDCEDLDESERQALSDPSDANQETDDLQKIKSKSTTTPGKSTQKKDDKPVFDHMTFICYAGHQISITKYFTENLKALSLDDVRKRLEKDFPELSKQRTKMDFDKKKNFICPIVTGGKKGASHLSDAAPFYTSSKELVENLGLINYLAAQDGIYEVRQNSIGVFVAKLPEKVLNMDEKFRSYQGIAKEKLEMCRIGFKPSLPKIPQHLFEQLISFFLDYTIHNVEVMGVFFWDAENKKYHLDIPKQRVSRTSIIPTYSEFPLNFIKVAEIHSHNTMPAYFSKIDDEDELGTMIYGVIGNLGRSGETVSFDIKMRAGVAGKFISLDPNISIEGEYYFKGNQLTQSEYPELWNKQVEIVGG